MFRIPFLSRLFQSSTDVKPKLQTIDYQGFKITPSPMKDGSSYRISAVVEKEVDGILKTHHLIRADTLGTVEAANDAAIQKAKTMIDQVGNGVFR